MAPHTDRMGLEVKVVIVFCILSFFIVAVSALARYVIVQDFTFQVEVPCDPEEQTCYLRDCEIDYCPPNNLTEYTLYNIRGYEYQACTTGTCILYCAREESQCEEILCDSESGESCT